jgi:hypothetical protein
MIAFNRQKAERCTDEKEAAKYDMQADKLELSRSLNIEFLEWMDAQ